MLTPSVPRPSAQPSRVRLPGLPKRKVIRAATGCVDVEQFVATFYRFCAADHCFVPTSTMRPAGMETVFALQLADGRPLVRGVAVVRAAWATSDNPYGRPGLELGFRRLTADSRALVTRMVTRRAALPPALEPHDSVVATIAMVPLQRPELVASIDAVVEAVEPIDGNDRTVRCAPAFADCEVDEPPRSAIATILGIAPLPKPDPRAAATTEKVAPIQDDEAPFAHQRTSAWWLVVIAATFVLAFGLALVTA